MTDAHVCMVATWILLWLYAYHVCWILVAMKVVYCQVKIMMFDTDIEVVFGCSVKVR